jgi:alanine racemase
MSVGMTRAALPAPPSRYRQDPQHEPSALEIDLSAVENNVRELRRLVGPDTLLYAALKCNAYGFGLVPVSHALADAGVDAVAVARVQDGIELRRGGFTLPVLLYGGPVVTPAVVEAVEQYELVPTILDLEAAKLISHRATRELAVFVKIDVGQRRLGVEPRRTVAFVEDLLQLPKLRLDGVYTHMAVPADPVPTGHLERQFELFETCLAELEDAGVSPRVRMAASSSVLRLSRSMGLNAVDPGRMYFGLIVEGPGVEEARFRSPFRVLRTRLIQVKEIDDDPRRPEPLVAVKAGMRVGIIPLGTADGLASITSGYVLVHSKRAPLIEPISLEHCRIDLSAQPEAEVGDEVVVVGAQAREQITIDDVLAAGRATNNQDVAIAVRESIPRVYVGPRTA